MWIRRIGAVVAIVLSASAIAVEDTLELKDGRVLSGKVLQQRDGLVWFEHLEHSIPRTDTFLDADIVRIVIDPVQEVPTAAPAAAEPVEVVRKIDVADEPAPLVIPADDVAMVRRDFFSLAPFLSMDHQVELEILNAARTAEKVLRIHTYATWKFDTHPLLSRVGRAHMRYLVESEARIIPVFRAEELDPEAMLMELFSRIGENQVVRIWQREMESKCRAAYHELLPLAAALAAAPDADDYERFQLTDKRGKLSLVNRSGTELTNATLAVTFISPSNQRDTAYYFVPTWPAGTSYWLRPPLDWNVQNGPIPMRLSVRVLSDQWSTTRADVDLPDNGRRAINHELDRIELLSSRYPNQAVVLLKGLKDHLPADSSLHKRYRTLHQQARISLNQEIKSLNETLKKQRSRLIDLRKQARSSGTSDFYKNMYQRNIAALERQISETESRLTELRVARQRW